MGKARDARDARDAIEAIEASEASVSYMGNWGRCNTFGAEHYPAAYVVHSIGKSGMGCGG